MHTLETTVVITIVMVSISMFLTFSFNIERKITEDINKDNEKIKTEYQINSKKTFVPEKIQRIIKNIKYFKDTD